MFIDAISILMVLLITGFVIVAQSVMINITEIEFKNLKGRVFGNVV